MPEFRRKILTALAVGGLVAAGAGGYSWWRDGEFHVSTDDAYVQADYTTIAPKVSGYVSAVLVADNQAMKAGDVLARIDDRDYATALAQAEAQVAADRASIQAIESEAAQQRAVIDQAKATVAADQAARVFSAQEFARYQRLMASGVATEQRVQAARSDISQKDAAVTRDQAAIAVANRQIDILDAALAKAQAALSRSEAMAKQAGLDLGYTVIRAPIDGVIGNRTLREGQFVQAGTQLMAVVPLQSVYVVGNYKETQLTHVRPGQKVTVTVDAFPDLRLRGRVDSVAPASGSTFALLPPDNATGNFTKIVQRIPVKITLDGNDPNTRLLRPGMSAEPVIDTGLASAGGVALAATPAP